MSGQVWMPHAGHFIGGGSCRFRLNTYTNGYIVSTVGEYAPSMVFDRGVFPNHQMRIRRDDDPVDQIGLDRFYETMVWPAKESGQRCCPFVAIVSGGESLDFVGYNTAADAYEGHMVMLDKWSTNS